MFKREIWCFFIYKINNNNENTIVDKDDIWIEIFLQCILVSAVSQHGLYQSLNVLPISINIMKLFLN